MYDALRRAQCQPGSHHPALAEAEQRHARGIGLVMGRTILEMEGQEPLRQRRIVQ